MEDEHALSKPERVDVTRLIYPELSFETEETQPIMDVEERKRRLSRFARENILTPSGRPHRAQNVESIKELNKMDGAYAPTRHQHAHIVFEVKMVEKGKHTDEN